MKINPIMDMARNMGLSLPGWAAWLLVRYAEDGLPVRHRVLIGGRGGGKSWAVAICLVLRAYKRQEHILCLREFQNSIRDSSKKLIEDVIRRLGLGDFFEISEREIRGSNGSLFTFVGLNGKDTSIKSFEGYTLAWVEEAATVSQASIDALIPTIRRPGSEIWWTYNPRFPTDPIDRMFRGDSLPPGTIRLEVHWNDNPWFPEVLQREMEYDRRRDPDKYVHIWLGGYLQHSEARVFQNWSVESFVAPENARFLFGADWGFSKDPTVLIRCFVGRWAGEPGKSAVIADPKGNCLFIDYEAHGIECEIDDTPALFAGSDRHDPPRWTNRFAHPGIPCAAKTGIIADSARPDMISHMRARGFNIMRAKKGKESITGGIAYLKDKEIYVHPRCHHLIDELIHYCWKTDRLTGAILSDLADDNNHVIDALRYATEGVRGWGLGDFWHVSGDPRVSAPAPTAKWSHHRWPKEFERVQPSEPGFGSAGPGIARRLEMMGYFDDLR